MNESLYRWYAGQLRKRGIKIGPYDMTRRNNKRGVNKGFDNSKPAHLYLLKSNCGCYIKIGISNNYQDRLINLRDRTPFGFKLVGLYSSKGSVVRSMELFLHKLYPRAGFRGFDASTEWFHNTKELQALCHHFDKR